MKREIASHELFFDWRVLNGIEKKWTRIAEPEKEQSEILDNVVWPDDQMNDLKEWADNTLRGNGIDPDALWNILNVEMIDEITGWKFQVMFLNWAAPQPKSFSTQILEAIDSIPGYEPLKPEPYGVLDVMVQSNALHSDVNRRAKGAALSDAMRLTTAIEHLKANRASREVIEKKRQHSFRVKNNNARSRAKTEWIAKTQWQPLCDEFARKNPGMSFTSICNKVGSELEPRISGRTIRRHCKESI